MITRQMNEQDFDAIVQLLEARAAHDGREPLSEHKRIRIGLAESYGTVTFDGGSIVAYAHAAHHPPASPAAHGRWAVEVVLAPGAGDESAVTSAALAAILDALPDGEPVSIWGWSPEILSAAQSLGFVEVRALHEMRCRIPVVGAAGAEAAVPSGVVIKPFRLGRDEDAWLVANNAAFAGHPENGALDRANLDRRLDQPWFDPVGFLLAWSKATLLGFCWTKLHPAGVGEIYIIGVVPAAQGKGLGRALVLAGLDDLARRQGAVEAMLWVAADDDVAIRLYESLGFEVIFTNRELQQKDAASA